MEENKEIFKPLNSEERNELWKKTLSTIRRKERKKLRIRYSIAAIALILLSLGGFIGYETFISPDVYVAQHNEINITLKDGTKIKLLNGAKLTVEKSFPGKTRDVFLQGDAVFEVTKSKEHPFIVHGTNYETKVLGTVFKIVQNNRNFKVDLYEGKVAVSEKGKGKTIYYLTPGKAFNNYGSSNIAAVTPLQEIMDKKVSSSKTNNTITTIDLHFSKSSVGEAINVMEKLYNIKIEYPQQYKNNSISMDLLQSTKDNGLQLIAAYLDLRLTGAGTTYTLEE
ncbi:hypothetical protein BAY13_17155 [Elizabethkingia bruuniana]|uniref:FecR family protein n=1 Tax=Elizabethkingia bruuniana TaxID=1756149 RepID=UPI000999E115|nr:FecR family protein [Elizabethkingia bruuniana]OPC66463.1 hypothetical protein BAY13_17155 [Elizabethkingia bruuniana]